MRKNNNLYFGFSITGFFLFLLTIGLTSACSILVYTLTYRLTDGNNVITAVAVIATIFIGAIICTLCDVYRRKTMIERPVKKILQATEKIASGDFSVKLVPTNDYGKYDAYDVVMENINTMASELSKNQILRNDFISNVSHEIKTPLAVIQNYVKTLQKKNISESEKQDSLKGLVLQTKKLSDLITNILKLNKLETQQIVPEIQEVDLAELLRLSILSFEDLFERKQLNLDCDIDEMKIVTSSNLLEIVFNNLISNAIKFTDEGGKISISLKSDKTHAIIKVQDTGCGISSEVGERIFEKFYQGDTSHSVEGNGLGLALVKKVIDLIGGEIVVESKLGVGTTFTIKLKKAMV